MTNYILTEEEDRSKTDWVYVPTSVEVRNTEFTLGDKLKDRVDVNHLRKTYLFVCRITI